MKKVISLLALMFIVSTTTFSSVKIDSSAIEKVTATTIDSTTFQTDARDALKSIVNVTGNIATNGYDIMVAQQRMYAYQYLGVGVLCLVFGYFFFRYYKKSNTKEPNSIIPAIIFLVGMIWTAIVFSMHYSQIIQGFVNPDYAAITEIVTLFRTGSGK